MHLGKVGHVTCASKAIAKVDGSSIQGKWSLIRSEAAGVLGDQCREY